MANGTELCKGGCGRTIPKNSATGYARGHAAEGCPTTGLVKSHHAKPKTSTALTLASQDEAEAEIVYEAPRVTMELDEQQLDRIYAMFPIEEKALGIMTALQADRG